MKRYAWFALAGILMVGGLVACSGEEAPATGDAAASKAVDNSVKPDAASGRDGKTQMSDGMTMEPPK